MAGTAGKPRRNTTPENAWAQLTWDDLRAWTNSRSVERGRSYQRSGRVRDLAVSADGQLLAWVSGSERYATRVELWPEEAGESKLVSRCTCPVGFNGCKHAVAVVLQYLQALKDKAPVPAAPAQDPRLSKLARADREEEREDEEFEDEGGWAEDEFADEDDFEGEGFDEDDSEEGSAEEAPPARGRRGPRWQEAAGSAAETPAKGRGKQQTPLRAYLEGLSATELVGLLVRLAETHPDVAEELSERRAVASGKTGDLLRQTRKEIDRVTGERGDYDAWHGGGHIPDYSGVKRKLEQLLDLGQADAVLELGRELLERGKQQVEESGDEGETASELADCLSVVFRAVLRSSLPGSKKLLYAIDMELEDDYDLCQGAEVVFDADWPAADWSAVADELARRLQALPAVDRASDFSASYKREGLSRWVIEALDAAGRGDETLAVLEAEARNTGSYERLVRRLLEDGKLENAARWALEGIKATPARFAGITHNLRTLLREVAERQKDWPKVAALSAEEFFERPSVEGLQQLTKAAAKAKCAEPVRAAALRFLETGARPVPARAEAEEPRRRAKGRTRTEARAAAADWPLPAALIESAAAEKGTAKGSRGAQPVQKPCPHYEVLLDLAIAEQRPDDALAWFDRLRGAKGSPGFYGYNPADHYADRVADAVAATHPERALAIYRSRAEKEIAATSPAAYERALPYLRKVRAVLHRTGRAGEWTKYVAQLRADNHRKRRFLELLDGLEGRPIIEG
jgi:uncharacterized Zn finger protein